MIVDLRGLKVGMLICYDVEFPENVRRLAQAGADLVAVPTALPASDHAAFIVGQHDSGARLREPGPRRLCQSLRRRRQFRLCRAVADSGPRRRARSPPRMPRLACSSPTSSRRPMQAAREANPYLDDLRQVRSRIRRSQNVSSALPRRRRSPWRCYTKAASPAPIADFTPVMSETISLPSVLSRSTAPTILPLRNTQMRSTRSKTWRNCG